MVAVKAHEADRFLAAPPDSLRLFLVYGSDQGAITERARRVERLAVKRGGAETVTRIGSDELSSDPGRVVDEVQSASLFGGEPVVALRVTDGRHNVIGAVGPVLDRPPDAAWLIVEAGDLASTSPLRKAFERNEHAVAVPAYPLEGRDLASFVRATAEEAGVTIDPRAFDMLMDSLGGDRLAARGELEKLLLYAGDSKSIGVEDVAAIVGDTTEARTDNGIDAALNGDHEALETELDRLRSEGGSAVAAGTLALRHLIMLQSLRVAVDAGSSVSDAMRFARPPIFFRRRDNVEAALSRWTARALASARRRIDAAIALTRLQPALENAAMSEAFHAVALEAQRLKRG
ncbi:MAG: DNA polymerase III subunit delta [Propylenella sp.]